MHNRGVFSKFFLIFTITIFLPACTLNFTNGTDDLQKAEKRYERLIEQGLTHYFNRRHTEAIRFYEQAGSLLPDRHEWLYEKARALFAMDRFAESLDLCRQAIDRAPDAYDAMALGWTARLQMKDMTDAVENQVRSEINALLAEHEDEIGALLGAHDGYGILDDKESRRRVMLKLAARSGAAEEAVRYSIGGRLFEEIIQARDDLEDQLLLMAAYIEHFPNRRFADFIVFRVLQKKKEAMENGMDPAVVLESMNPASSESPRINIGVARWLIEEDRQNDKAVDLVTKSIEMEADAPISKPPDFTDDLWAQVLERETDYWRYLLGRALYQAGKPDAAEKELMRVAEKNRGWGGVYHYLGEIALAKGQIQGAMNDYRRALETEPRPEDALPRLKALLAEHRNFHEDPALFFNRASNGVYFSDITPSAGLSGVAAHRVAWGDFDSDGFPDLLVDGRRLFRNLGGGKFHDGSEEAGLGDEIRSSGGLWLDYDNDGDLDIFTTAHGVNRLFENTGEGRFIDATDTALPHPVADDRTEAAACGDMDNDGFLDLYVANYERKGIKRALGTPDRLYRNNGDGTFSDISQTAGIQVEEAMCGRGVSWVDVNADGFQDIVVANYRLDPNFLWMNQTGQSFDEASEKHGVRGHMVQGAFGHSIGAVSGDLTNDGFADIFITNLAHPRYIQYSDENMMLINQGPANHYFIDQFDASGIAFEETNADPALADVDNDGDLDLYMTSIYPGRYSHLYLNDGEGHFFDASWLSRTRVANAWGAAFADYDSDGWPDLVVAGKDGLRLFRNNGGRNNWIKVILRDLGCNFFGIGAAVEISYGEQRQARVITAGRGVGSQDENALIFGLGEFTGPLTIECRSLCGRSATAMVEEPNQTVFLKIR